MLVGAVAKGRAGVGSLEVPRFDKVQGKEQQELIQMETIAAVEKERNGRVEAMRHQGAWTKWEWVMERKITWNDLWKLDSHHINFLIQAVYDVLPSPSNLHCWGLAE